MSDVDRSRCFCVNSWVKDWEPSTMISSSEAYKDLMHVNAIGDEANEEMLDGRGRPLRGSSHAKIESSFRCLTISS